MPIGIHNYDVSNDVITMLNDPAIPVYQRASNISLESTFTPSRDINPCVMQT